MLRWMRGITKITKIRNEHVRGSVKVAPMTQKITEKRIKWCGHVQRRDMLRRMLDAPVAGQIRRGRQKTRCKDPFKIYIWNVRG